jgi:hypothetical protein
LKNRLHQRTGIFKNSYIPFFPYQIDNNAEGDLFHSSNNDFALKMEAPNSTVDGAHTSAKPKPGFNFHP